MASVISWRRLHADPIAQPRLRPVGSDRTNRVEPSARVPHELAKTAVVACLHPRSSGNGDLLRKARRAARGNDGEFYAVLVDSARSRFGKGQAGTLLDEVILASYFGAKIIWLKSSDVVGELIEFARQFRVGRIFVSRNQPRPFFRRFGRSIYSDLLSRGEGFHIDVVGFDRRN